MKSLFATTLAAVTLLTAPLCAVAKDGPATATATATVSVAKSAESPIAAALKPFVDEHALAGAVALVADKDKVLSITTVGFADIAGGKPMKPDTTFWIASQTKAITAAAVMILVDEGKISLDDPIEKYLPEMKALRLPAAKDSKDEPQPPKTKVTIRQCLSHTSGMPFQSAAEKPTLDCLPLETAVKSYATTPMVAEPGTLYLYSNAGINTAGRIIEVVSGKKYEDFLDERLLKPLGMNDTTYWPSEEQVARLATSYKPNKPKDATDLEATKIGYLKYPFNSRTDRYPMPGGGLFSTAEDVSKFCRMMLRGGEFDGKRVLSEAAIKELTTDQTREAKNANGSKPSYGLGFAVSGSGFGHGGAMATNMSIDKNLGLVTVWLVQHAGFPKDGGKAQGVFVNKAKELYGKK
jgi:CubicO group peptidase (beta-lactamase class C family)